MNRKPGRLWRLMAGLVSLFMLVLAGCGSGSSPSGSGGGGAAGNAEPLKVGVLAPISGPLSPYGDFLKKGVEVGRDLINQQGGILGRQVQVIIEDDKTDPAAAAERAKKLLQQDKVDVLMGTISSATTLAVIPLAEQAKIPYIYVVEGESKTCTKDGKTSPYIFGNGPTPEQKFINFVPYMLKNFGKKYYFVGSDYVFPHFANGIGIKALKEQGGQVVGEDYAPLGTNEFSTIITKIERANPDVIFTSVVGTDGVAFVKQLSQFGLDKKMKVTGFPSFSPSVFEGIKDIAQNAYVPARYTDVIDNPMNKAFVDAYRKQWNYQGPISGSAAMGGYGTLLMYKAAIEKAKSTKGDDVAKALEGLKVMTPQGEVTIDAGNHIVNQHVYLLQIKGNRYEIAQDFGVISHPGQSGCSRE